MIRWNLKVDFWRTWDTIFNGCGYSFHVQCTLPEISTCPLCQSTLLAKIEALGRAANNALSSLVNNWKCSWWRRWSKRWWTWKKRWRWTDRRTRPGRNSTEWFARNYKPLATLKFYSHKYGSLFTRTVAWADGRSELYANLKWWPDTSTWHNGRLTLFRLETSGIIL